MRHIAPLVLAGCAAASAAPQAQKLAQDSHSIYKELVEIDTTQSNGDTAKAAHAMEAHLLAAGFPKADVQVFEPAPKRGDLVARLRGTGVKKPMILMAHIDVVEAKKTDWSTDPFKLVEKDGYFYGRGTGDDKFMAAAWVANMVRWKQEGYAPDRDLILVLECDEEISDEHEYGIKFLLAKHKDLFGDADLALNEGGGVAMIDGKPRWNSIQTTEKLFQSFWLETHNKGGHSSQPRKDNAIYELADALVKLEKYEFPFELNATTRAYFAAMAKIEKGQNAADMKAILAAKPNKQALARLSAQPPYNATIRTTCVATRLEGGHADNALPQVARAMVNCRILPGHSPDEVQAQLAKVIGDAGVTITAAGKDTTSEPLAVDPELEAAATQVGAKFWPGIPVVPTMSAGATDGRYLRNAGIKCYGHSGLAGDIFDVRAHGKDERVGTKAFDDGVEYLYELVKVMAGGK
ncbi:MAG TPA: M20/M25/M40 family metallo-hydrolase [Kofleriaceae bacterium]|nr:M20/M25/M40 family metallo-hydrolase [Kofleriaceae bacterium]